MRSDCSLNSISTCTGKSQGESGTQTLLIRPQDTSIRICPARPNSHARTGIFFSFSCPADHESGSQPTIYTHMQCSKRVLYTYTSSSRFRKKNRRYAHNRCIHTSRASIPVPSRGNVSKRLVYIYIICLNILRFGSPLV